jgi:Tfp pilus assembly pilus retraction ATPase PilT
MRYDLSGNEETADAQPAWIWEACTVKQFAFTDLFLSADSAEIRGIPREAEGAPVLRAVPQGALVDLDVLRSKVMTRSEESEFLLDYEGMRFRCTRIDDVDATWFNLRRSRSPLPRLYELGIGSDALLNALVELGAPGRAGLFLVSGAMGHGKTTTACSLLQEWLIQHGDVAVTIEDPPEMVMNRRYGHGGRCYQTQAPGGDFGLGMRLTVRRSPRYILLGEIRGPVEASQAIRAAVTGQVVVSTVHANDPISAIRAVLKLVSGHEDMEMAQEVLADGLLAVMHQELRRRVVDGMLSLHPETTPLVVGSSAAGSRSLIRSGKLTQLSTEIAAQKARLAAGRPPLHNAA